MTDPAVTATQPMSIEALMAALTAVTEGGEAWGQDVHPSKNVLVRTPGEHEGSASLALVSVSASFVNGQFCLVLDTVENGSCAGTPDGLG